MTYASDLRKRYITAKKNLLSKAVPELETVRRPPVQTKDQSNQSVHEPELVFRRLGNEIAAKHDMTLNAMIVAGRTAAVVAARRELFYRLANDYKWSLPKIGKYTKRTHTTVLHGVRGHCAATGAPLSAHMHPKGAGVYGKRRKIPRPAMINRSPVSQRTVPRDLSPERVSA